MKPNLTKPWLALIVTGAALGAAVFFGRVENRGVGDRDSRGADVTAPRFDADLEAIEVRLANIEGLLQRMSSSAVRAAAPMEPHAGSVSPTRHQEAVVPQVQTERQKQFEAIHAKLQQAAYHRYTMQDLSEEMISLPPAMKHELLTEVTRLFNSGQLDPQQFVSGAVP